MNKEKILIKYVSNKRQNYQITFELKGKQRVQFKPG